jgi:pimeloyl-ACP methyl ester carboxylesterase
MLERTGGDRYPGDMTPSANWPNVAPGVWGPINATSPKHFNGSGIVDEGTKPPVLWIRGEDDQIVSDMSLFDFGTLGQMELVPGWPGADVFPPQPMVSQMRAVLDKYQENGGQYTEVAIADAGHSPLIEKPEEFRQALVAFLEDV